jgi:hypothetical protein
MAAAKLVRAEHVPGEGTCPYCRRSFHVEVAVAELEWAGTKHPTEEWHYSRAVCPSCGGTIVNLKSRTMGRGVLRLIPVWPKNTGRAPAASDVPEPLRTLYDEASAVLSDSPRASAALARRCLQQLLRDKGFTGRTLADEVDAVLAAKVLPDSLAETIDAIRHFGNFAAHPVTDTAGQIVDVEEGEAEWTLDVLEELFEHFYVAPQRRKAKIDAANAKITAAGKPPMKGPKP